MVQFYIGDMLTGRRIQILPDVLSGSWAEKLNAPDDLSCTVPMGDPVIRRMQLGQSATPGKAFLAAVVGDTVLAGGPILSQSFDDDGGTLRLNAAGMWAYFDRRILHEDLSIVSSLQGIARQIMATALAEPFGDVPVILPDELPGSHERNYIGTDLTVVGEELRNLTALDGGPDIKFVPRFNEDRDGFEWVMQIGTPDQPLIYGPTEPVFNVGLAESSVSNFSVDVSGEELSSHSFATGGRGEVLLAEATDSTLTDAGYPLYQAKDTTHSSVSEEATLQGWADELALRSKSPWTTISFSHRVNVRPFLAGFNVGDFANLHVRENAYLPDGTYRSRIVGRSGDEKSDVVSLTFEPEVL